MSRQSRTCSVCHQLRKHHAFGQCDTCYNRLQRQRTDWYRTWSKDYRKKKREAGICVDCKELVVPDRIRCPNHLFEDNARTQSKRHDRSIKGNKAGSDWFYSLTRRVI